MHARVTVYVHSYSYITMLYTWWLINHDAQKPLAIYLAMHTASQLASQLLSLHSYVQLIANYFARINSYVNCIYSLFSLLIQVQYTCVINSFLLLCSKLSRKLTNWQCHFPGTNCYAQYYYRGFLRGFLREFPDSPPQASLLHVGIYVRTYVHTYVRICNILYVCLFNSVTVG